MIPVRMHQNEAFIAESFDLPTSGLWGNINIFDQNQLYS